MDGPPDDGYVVPIDSQAIRRRMQGFIAITVLQLLVAVVVSALVAGLVGSLRAALPFIGLIVIVLVLTMWRDPVRWQQYRSSAAHPPMMTAAGIRLLLVAKTGHDLLVPWEQVSKASVIATTGGWWALRIHVDNVEKVAGEHPRQLREIRRIKRPAGAPFVHETSFVRATPGELDEALSRHSRGRCTLES